MPRRFSTTLLLALAGVIAFTLPGLGVPQAPALEDHVRELVLDNGLKVVVAERHQTPVFFTLISFRVGSCQELPNRSGLAHFLEHMLFKGTQTLGTSDFPAESKLMDKLEKAAEQMKASQVAIQSWRLDKFDEYTLNIRANLTPEEQQAAGTEESAIWRVTLSKMPTDVAALPSEWTTSPWILREGTVDYWALYRTIIEKRIEMADLLAEQRKLISVSKPLSSVYEPLGGEGLNAFTANDQTTYMLGLPSNCLEMFFFIESDRFQHPVFREFYPEREVVQEELRNGKNEPESMLYYTFMQTAFDAHPYGRPVIGWISDIKLTLREDMEAYFWQYYTPNNCQITIAGDVKADEVFAMAKKYFSAWKPGDPSPEVTIREPEQHGEKRVVVQQDAEPQLMIGWHIPAAPDPDSYPLGMAMQILSNGKTSRFYRNIYVGQDLTAGSPGADDGPSSRYPNLFIVSAAPKAPHTPAEVEAAIYAEIDKLKNEPVSAWELERLRNGIRKNDLQRFASNRWLAFTLSGNFVNFGDWRYAKTNFDRQMAVTPADIQRVVTKYLTPENRIVATLVKTAPLTSEEGSK